MLDAQNIMQEEDYKQILAICDELAGEANAKLVFIVDKNGQLIANSGNVGDLDTTALGSLAAGNIAATDGLAKLLGEQEFSVLFHEGDNENLHISLIATRYILVVVFDKKTSLGLVRLKVKKTSQKLETLFQEIYERNEKSGAADSIVAEITDDDIDNLFDD